MDKVTVLGATIAYYQKNEQDYISLTDMVKSFENLQIGLPFLKMILSA